MFCKNCGKQMDDNAMFCAGCGASVNDSAQSQVQPQAQPQYSPGRKDTIVIEVSKDVEQKTITRYQKFGWVLLNNQEVNITQTYGGGSTVNGTGSTYVSSSTVTYIKLTFERNLDMKNFQQINQKYQEYRGLEEEYRKLENEIYKKGFSWLWFLITTVVGGFLLDEIIFRGLFAWIEGALSYVMILCLGACIGVPFGYLGGKMGRNALEKKIRPQLEELNQRMEQLANEAFQLLV